MSKISTLYNKIEEFCYNKNIIDGLINNKLDSNMENFEVTFDEESGILIFSNELFSIDFDKEHGTLTPQRN